MGAVGKVQGTGQARIVGARGGTVRGNQSGVSLVKQLERVLLGFLEALQSGLLGGQSGGGAACVPASP